MSKTVVITGSSRGLGFALAKEFCKNNHTVVLNGRHAKKLARAKQSILNEYPQSKITICPCDISNNYCAASIARNIKKKHGHIDYWINNAATCANKRCTLSEFSYDEINDILSTNLLGTIYGCKAACEIMTRQPSGGKIINIDGSGSNGEIIPGFLAYSTSKGNIRYVGQFLDSELKHTNVQVHTISPGIMETEFLNTIEKRSPVFNALVQYPDVVAEIMVKQIESVEGSHKHINIYSFSRLFVEGSHKHINIYSFSRLFMLLFNIFKKYP